MTEFKIGPIAIVSLRQGLKFELSFFIKSISLYFVAVGLSILGGILTNIIRDRDNATALPLASDLLLPLSIVVIFGFGLRYIYRANRIAFVWFFIKNDKIILFNKKPTTKTLKEIPIQSIISVIFSKNYLFSPSFNSKKTLTWVFLRYRKPNSAFNLDSIINLGPKKDNELDSLRKIISDRLPGIQIKH